MNGTKTHTQKTITNALARASLASLLVLGCAGQALAQSGPSLTEPARLPMQALTPVFDDTHQALDALELELNTRGHWGLGYGGRVAERRGPPASGGLQFQGRRGNVRADNLGRMANLAFRWAEVDRRSRWQPSAVAGSGGRVFVSWSFRRGPLFADQERGVRVSFVRVGASRITYEHAILVEPCFAGDQATFKAVNTEGGFHGLAYSKNRLFLVGKEEIRIFDLTRILEVEAGQPRKIGRDGGSFHGHGHSLAIPQQFKFEVTSGSGLTFGTADVDRSLTPPALVLSGRYVEKTETTSTDLGNCISRFELDPTSGLFARDRYDRGLIAPSRIYLVGNVHSSTGRLGVAALARNQELFITDEAKLYVNSTAQVPLAQKQKRFGSSGRDIYLDDARKQVWALGNDTVWRTSADRGFR
jgi:hypothetical protein